MKKIVAVLLVIFLSLPNSVEGKEEALALDSEFYVLMEANTGTVLASKNKDEIRSPASITKIMTVLLIFEALEQRKLSLTDMVVTSEHAKSMGGSQVFLEEGEEQTVETMIKCILIASGNDASVAMAEKIGGSEEKFVEMMNEKARKLGMKRTHFVDCCGLTDSDEHYTTAEDVALVTRELVTKYPQVLDYSSIWMETIVHKTKQGEKEFVLSNTNKLLKANDWVKGLKTGSTSKAKYCVSNVAVKDGITLISVVMAAPNYKVRFSDSYRLLNYGFSKCKVYRDSEKTYSKELCGGEKNQIHGSKMETFYVDTTGMKFEKIRSVLNWKEKLEVPIRKGDVLGTVDYYYDNQKICSTEIVAKESVKEAGFGMCLKYVAGKLLQIG